MKLNPRFAVPVIVLALLALAAVGVASAARIGNMVMSGPAVQEVELIGTVESVTPESWTIQGKEVFVTPQTEIKDPLLTVGDMVKVHVLVGADGTLTAREIESLISNDVQGNENENGNVNENDNDDMNDNDDDLNDNVDNGNDDDDNENDDNSNMNDDDSNDNDDNGNDNDDDDNNNDNDNDDDDNDNDDDDNDNDDDDNDNDDDDNSDNDDDDNDNSSGDD